MKDKHGALEEAVGIIRNLPVDEKKQLIDGLVDNKIEIDIQEDEYINVTGEPNWRISLLRFKVNKTLIQRLLLKSPKFRVIPNDRYKI